jgi:hypothetical protein
VQGAARVVITGKILHKNMEKQGKAQKKKR